MLCTQKEFAENAYRVAEDLIESFRQLSLVSNQDISTSVVDVREDDDLADCFAGYP